jgi:hypothetical protein
VALIKEHEKLVVQLRHATARRDMWDKTADDVFSPFMRQWKDDMEREFQTVNERLHAAQLQVRPLVSVGQGMQLCLFSESIVAPSTHNAHSDNQRPATETCRPFCLLV